MRDLLVVVFCAIGTFLTVTSEGQLRVTEVMYDPASTEGVWEWIEVYNPTTQAVDLDGYLIDRLGDLGRAESTTPNIRSSITFEGNSLSNPTVVPASGVAILYNGSGLSFDSTRFRSAWPQTPVSTVIIGVDGWSSNQLNNDPEPSDFDLNLPGRTIGFWASDDDYRLDVFDVGTVDDPDRRVTQVANTAFTFSYDNNPPWPESNNAASIELVSSSPLSGEAWRVSTVGEQDASQSIATFLSSPINDRDYGSPGIPPPLATDRLLMTEIMYNPASVNGSKEWEWVEIYNGTQNDLDFSLTPHWFDDDDGSALSQPNLTNGQIPAGETGLLFNASAAAEEDFRAAWPTVEWLIPVTSWPVLNNTGDVIGLWSNSSDYTADFEAKQTVARTVAGTYYDNASPWPSDNNADSITLKSLLRNQSNGANWTRATGDSADPSAYRATPVFTAGLPDNSGQDVGSPGFVSGLTSSILAGDYNGDGVVDAADYTVWRDGGPLMNETVSLGAVDVQDYFAWRANYGTTASAIVLIPEPMAIYSLVVFQVLVSRRLLRIRV